jgi:hypothetical protein
MNGIVAYEKGFISLQTYFGSATSPERRSWSAFANLTSDGQPALEE